MQQGRAAPAAHARGSFGGCPSDCSARHEHVLCDRCSVPWELHMRSHNGHGCNDEQKRGSFDGCDKSCEERHEGVRCDTCNRPWEIQVIYKLHMCVTRVNMLARTIYAHVNVLKYATIYAHVNCSNLIKVAYWRVLGSHYACCSAATFSAAVSLPSVPWTKASSELTSASSECIAAVSLLHHHGPFFLCSCSF